MTLLIDWQLRSCVTFSQPTLQSEINLFTRFVSINDHLEFLTLKNDQFTNLMLLFRFLCSSEWRRLSEWWSKQQSADVLAMTPSEWRARLDALFLLGEVNHFYKWCEHWSFCVAASTLLTAKTQALVSEQHPRKKCLIFGAFCFSEFQIKACKPVIGKKN